MKYLVLLFTILPCISIAQKSDCHLEVTCSKGSNGGREKRVPIQLPIRGPQGPPGQCYASRKKVAFFVGLKANFGPVDENTDVKFDKIVTNVGQAYNKTTGHFVAPFAGVYQFNVVISPVGKKRVRTAAVYMAHNGIMVFTVWSESLPFWASATNSAILQLKKNDHVWLVLLNKASHLHGFMYSTFSGHFLFTT